MLFVCSWLWGDKWGVEYAERLFAGVRRNLKQEFRTILATDRPAKGTTDIVYKIEDVERPFLERRGCLVRMRMFDLAWQAKIGAHEGDRIVNIDVDAVVVRDLDPLFDRDDEFAIMQGFNQTNPCPFNGSLWMLRAGVRPDVWTDLNDRAVRKISFHAFPDDQGWLHHKFPNAGSWTAKAGVYAFKKIGWPVSSRGIKHGLPDNARIVAFPGRDPGDYLWLGWVRKHWAGGSALITEEYAHENARLHTSDPNFGAEGYLWAYHVAGIAIVEGCETILDYGCGKGTLGKILRDVSFEQEADGAGLQFAFGVREYDPGSSGRVASPNPADLVACLDVLEHVEPDCIDDVIDDLARLAGKLLFVVISTKQSKRKMSDGRDTHLSLHDDVWWHQKFIDHGFTTKRIWNTGLRLWVALLKPPQRTCS